MIQKPPSIRNRFNFDKFIDSIIELDSIQMFQAIDGECRRVEASMTGRGGLQARADGGSEYVARLKRVAFWFHHGRTTSDNGEVATCFRIAKKLVERGQIKPEILDVLGRSGDA